MERERLDILQTAHIGGRISDMTYGNVAGQFVQMILAEYLDHEPRALMQMHALFIGTYYSTTLLTAVLKAVQCIIGILGGILNTVYAKHSAFVMQFFHIIYTYSSILLMARPSTPILQKA